MHSRILILVGMLIALLAGCATQPVSASHAMEARALNAMYATKEPGDGHIVVIRDTGFAGAACTDEVSVDGTSVAMLRPGQKIDAYVKPGYHIISSAAACGCQACKSSPVSIGADIGAMTVRAFRISINAALSTQIMATTQ